MAVEQNFNPFELEKSDIPPYHFLTRKGRKCYVLVDRDGNIFHPITQESSRFVCLTEEIVKDRQERRRNLESFNETHPEAPLYFTPNW